MKAKPIISRKADRSGAKRKRSANRKARGVQVKTVTASKNNRCSATQRIQDLERENADLRARLGGAAIQACAYLVPLTWPRP